MSVLVLVFLTAGASAQTEQADYLWFVDVSGHRNIYIEGIQQSIDSFYIEASKHDHLRVYNFANGVVPLGEPITDEQFYKYSDLTAVLQTLDSLVDSSQSKYVRAFILSDFHNSDTVNGNVALSPDSLIGLREALSTHCFEKDVKFYLMVIPPTIRYKGYSIHAMQAILPFGSSEVFGVTPDSKTTEFMLSKVYELNRLRGIDDSKKPNGLIVAVLIFVAVFMLVVCGMAIWKKSRNKQVK